MPLISDPTVFQKSLATLPLATYQPGETVFAEGSRTGRLMFLKTGAVAIFKDAIEITRVTEPGAMFGELSILLDQPHTADVRALETSVFHVADAGTLLAQDHPVAIIYVAMVLARRLDSANQALIQLKSQLQAGPRSAIGKTVEKMEILLSASGGNLLYGGYPFDPDP